MSVRLFIVVLITSIGTYLFNYWTLEKQSMHELEKYINERVEREKFYIGLVEKNLSFLAMDLTRSLHEDMPNIDEKFHKLFEKLPNGTYREREFSNPFRTQLFIRRDVKLNEDLKKRIILVNNSLERFGYAWSSVFLNSWVTGVEDYALSFTPTIPHSLHYLNPEYSFEDFESVVIGLPTNNPKGEQRWTGPFYDETLKRWIISANQPFYYNGNYLLSFGMDFDLSTFNQRVQKIHLEGAYTTLFDNDGRLISHPSYIDKIKSSRGFLHIPDLDDKILNTIFEQIRTSTESIVYSLNDDVFYAVKKIPGPNWWFVIVYPQSSLTALARKTGFFVAFIGLLSLLIELFLLGRVLKKNVASPISKLIKAVDKVTKGDNRSRVNIDSNNEVGRLARSFNAMAEKVMERDSALLTQTVNLENQVQERTEELDKQRANSINASKMAMIVEMSGRIAHEINNPLATIYVSAEASQRHLRKESHVNERVLNYLGKIKSTSERIAKIVNGMRAFNQVNEEGYRIPVPISKILSETILLCHESVKSEGIEIVVHHYDDLIIEVREVQIIHILLSLIQNSIEALADVSEKRIDIYVKKVLFDVKFIVEDSGPGIPENLIDKVMHPFFTTKEIGKGMGLGLFIASGYATANGGELYYDKDAKKSRFILELPIYEELKDSTYSSLH